MFKVFYCLVFVVLGLLGLLGNPAERGGFFLASFESVGRAADGEPPWFSPPLFLFCGERGIRTPETLLTFTRFPGVPLQPLEHLSSQGAFLRLRYNSSHKNNYFLVSEYLIFAEKFKIGVKKASFYVFL